MGEGELSSFLKGTWPVGRPQPEVGGDWESMSQDSRGMGALLGGQGISERGGCVC